MVTLCAEIATLNVNNRFLKRPTFDMDRHFSTALDAILRNWVALQLSLSHSGVNAAQFNPWLNQSITQWFKDNQNLEAHEVEGFLEDVVATEFDVEIDDGSYPEVAALICRFFQICSTQPEEQVLAQLRTLPKCDMSQCQIEDEDERDHATDPNGEPSEPMDTEGESRPIRSAPPEPDEDGFVTVVSRKKR